MVMKVSRPSLPEKLPPTLGLAEVGTIESRLPRLTEAKFINKS